MSVPAIDMALLAMDLRGAGPLARTYEELGFDGVYTLEGPLDPFTPLFLAAEHTREVTLSTGVAVAFARNPMVLAQLAHELQAMSGGRFVLGLGTQIRAHIERRFSETWSAPVERMRELIAALRAIWACWNRGQPLDFQGRFYRHTLMTPIFDPGAHGHGDPPVVLGAVGPRMTALAAEVADGLLLHPMTSPEAWAGHTAPAVARGLARGGRRRQDLQVIAQVMIATGADDAAVATARSLVRQQIAFYASTPAYLPLIEACGGADRHPRLHALSRQGRWGDMAALIDDELVDRVAVCGEPREVGRALARRYDGIADRVACAFLGPPEPGVLADVIQGARA